MIMKQNDIINAYSQSGMRIYDLFMQDYFKLFEEDTKQAYPEFFKKLQLKPNQKVLEIGFGTGINLLFYPEFINLIGLDLIPQMLETAKNKAKELNKINVEFIVSDGHKIPYKDNYFDVVVVTFTLCVAENPQKILQEIIRVCKPNGIIGIFEYKKANSNFMVLKDQKLLAETMREIGSYHKGQPAIVFDPLFDLDTLIQNSNLQIIDQLKIENSFIECLGRYILQKKQVFTTS